jgi:tyrosine-protein phosphatase SIW14
MRSRLVRWLAVSAALIVMVLAYAAELPQHARPSVSVDDSPLQHPAAKRMAAEGLPGLAEVSPRLFRGGQPTAAGFQTLARMGISIVVDARGGSRESEREKVTSLGMEHVAIPWHCPIPRDKVFARFLAVIRGSPGKKVFVHCRLGDDRVGMMIAAYRMAEEGWTAKEAMQEMKAYGFAFSHHLICPCLAHYEKTFPQRYKAHPVFRSRQ